jgi:thiosulfate/3-mercaptopyruvate sulfurtransferase
MVLTERVVLLDVAELAGLLAAPDPPTLIDVRWRLGGPPGRSDHLAGHIPGAAFVDLDAQLCGPPGRAGRHPLPDPAELQAVLRRAGVRTGHPVIVYDGGESQAAARAWWTLRWVGHDDVRVLDGGFAAWVAAGQPTESGEVTPAAGDIVVRPGQLPVLDADGAAEMARTGSLLDARVGPRFRGEMEPVDPVAGHIPGAVNLPAADLLGDDGRLRPPHELRKIFEEAGVRGPVGAYCGSGVTAANTVLALHRAGFTEAALYVGSWSNWVALNREVRASIAGAPAPRSGAGDR